MLMPDLEDIAAISALMLGLGVLLDICDSRKTIAAAIKALLRRRTDRRTAFARRRWPQPLSRLEGDLVGWSMNGAAASLIRDLRVHKGWKRWRGR
jgi:hypothetical protein